MSMQGFELQQSPQRITTLEIAELTGKPHKDVLKAVRTMEPAWVKVNGRKFSLVSYKDQKGESRPCYSLNKAECLYVATKFNDEARAKLVLRWEELERAAAVMAKPMTKEQLLAQAVLIANEEIKQLNVTIEQQKPKVEYCDDVLMSEDCVTTTQVAKHFGLSAKSLNEKLHELGIQFKLSGQWHLYAHYSKFDFTRERTSPYYDTQGVMHTSVLTVWTERGKRFLSELISNDYDVRLALQRIK